jgi:hypothetical protein
MLANRRNILRAIFTGGAIAAIPAGLVLASDDNDAEILALYAEFERLWEAFLPVHDAATDSADIFHEKILSEGWETACAWATASGHNERVEEQNRLSAPLSRIIERMVALKPKTVAGIAAIAVVLRADALSSWWSKPERDRDWDIELVTRFLDGLIETREAMV